MLDILQVIPGKKRLTSSGWHVFNAVCCHHRGHNPDRRQRAGVKFGSGTDWSYSCFNCGFKCGFHLGKNFSLNLKQLLGWCGLDREEVDRLSFQCFTHRTGVEGLYQKKAPVVPVFNEVELPDGALPIGSGDSIHRQYILKRGLDPDGYPYYAVPGEHRERLVIPYYWRGKLVGYTSRYYDGRHPKYVSMGQRGYVFNVDGQAPDWSVCILVEGQFDALAIGGCACMGSNITDEQAETIKTLDRRVVFVPDRDKAGLGACSRALDLGYDVSIPEWGSDIKDVNDAVRKYGRLPTLLSILGARTSSRVVVEIKRKKLQ